MSREPTPRGADDPLAPLYRDLWLVGGFAALVAAVALSGLLAGSPLRVALAVVYVLFVPGYASVAALFPDAGALDGVERVALSFGSSVALTGLVALGLNFSRGIRLLPVVAALTAFTLGLLAVAGVRRRRVASVGAWPLRQGDESAVATPFVVPFDRLEPLARDRWAALTGRRADDRLERALAVALVCAVLLAAGSAAWALSTPRPGDEYTELYLLTERDGELVADDYPAALTVGEPAEVVVAVDNHEFRTERYSLVVSLRDPDADRVTRLRTVEDLRLSHGEAWRRPVAVEPPFAGEDLRLEYRLYRGPPEGDPYRTVFLNVSVAAG